MKKCIAIVVLATFLLVGCGKKKKATPAAGSGAGSAAEIANPGVDAVGVATPVDGAQAARATSSRALLTLTAAQFGSMAPAAKGAAMGKLIDATVAEMRRGSRDRWDVSAVVAAVGPDRAALFTWVRDQTALVPYRGSLRGPVGVLMDRVGNSLDRALLLAALLNKAGLTVRLANAALDADASGKLAASWRARSRPALPALLPDDSAFLDQLIKLLGVDATKFRASYVQYETAHKDVATRTKARVASQLAALAKLVPPGKVPPGDPRDPTVFTDHWWVQVEDNGVWLDLDPSLPEAEPGQALAVPGNTLKPDELGDDRRHTLTVRVTAEVWNDRVREETALLEHTFAPASFFGQRIKLTTIPIDMPAWDELRAAPHPVAATTAALAAQTEWIPLLQFDASVIAQKSVTDRGEVFDLLDAHGNATRLARVVQRVTKQSVGGATDLLGQLPDDPSGAAPPAKPAIAESSGFTALWVEYELRSPGEPPRIARRVVFDALGLGTDRSTAKPTKLTDPQRLERSLALIGDVELLPMFAEIPEAFVLDRAAKALEDARPVFVEIAALEGQAPSKELLGRVSGIPQLPGPVYSLALARFAWSPVGAQVYLDRLNLLVESRRVVTHGTGFRVRDGFDIAANTVRAWPSSQADERSIRMTQGIVDTAVEAVILRCPLGSTRCVRGVNTSDELAARSGTWTVVTSTSDPQLARMPAAARAIATTDLADGYTLVMPPGPAAVTWWRVDPGSGESLGMGPLGGNAGAEEAIMQAALIVGGGYASAAGCLLSLGLGGTGPMGFAYCMGAVGSGLVGSYFGLELKKNFYLVVASAIIGSAFGIGGSIIPGP